MKPRNPDEDGPLFARRLWSFISKWCDYIERQSGAGVLLRVRMSDYLGNSSWEPAAPSRGYPEPTTYALGYDPKHVQLAELALLAARLVHSWSGWRGMRWEPGGKQKRSLKFPAVREAWSKAARDLRERAAAIYLAHGIPLVGEGSVGTEARDQLEMERGKDIVDGLCVGVQPRQDSVYRDWIYTEEDDAG